MQCCSALSYAILSDISADLPNQALVRNAIFLASFVEPSSQSMIQARCLQRSGHRFTNTNFTLTSSPRPRRNVFHLEALDLFLFLFAHLLTDIVLFRFCCKYFEPRPCQNPLDTATAPMETASMAGSAIQRQPRTTIRLDEPKSSACR